MTGFTLQVARELLQKLASDDEFRKLFEKKHGQDKNEARKALLSLGHKTPGPDHGNSKRDPVVALEDMQGGLASKEFIAANTDTWLATFAEDADVSARA